MEGLNRTLQEPFVDDHETLRFDGLTAFHRKLADWLLAYTMGLPHQSLGCHASGQFRLHQHPEGQSLSSIPDRAGDRLLGIGEGWIHTAT